MSQIQIPSHFSQMLTICRYELLKSLRGKKILAILSISFGISLGLLLVPEITGFDAPNSVNEFFSIPLGFVFFVLVITVAFFASSAIVSEFHERTGYSLFPNPVSRETIWFGKFLATEILSFAVIGIYYGIISMGALVTYGELPAVLGQSFAFAFLVVTMLTSISFFVSSFSRGPTGAAVIVFLLFILVLPMVDQLMMNFGEVKPWYTPTFVRGIIENVMLEPYPLDLEPGEFPRGPNDFQRFVPYIDDSILIMISYIIIFSLASIFLFKRREMLN